MRLQAQTTLPLDNSLFHFAYKKIKTLLQLLFFLALRAKKFRFFMLNSHFPRGTCFLRVLCFHFCVSIFIGSAFGSINIYCLFRFFYNTFLHNFFPPFWKKIKNPPQWDPPHVSLLFAPDLGPKQSLKVPIRQTGLIFPHVVPPSYTLSGVNFKKKFTFRMKFKNPPQ